MGVHTSRGILRCNSCGQQLRVPSLGKELIVTCPRCKNQFTHRSAPTNCSKDDNDGSELILPGLSAAGERTAMWLGIAAIAATMLLLVFVGMWPLPPILIAFTAIVVWVQQSQLVGNAVRVSKSQFPEIYASAETAAARLGMQRPEVFIHFSPVLNAAATGFLGRKSVILNSALVEAMSQDELLTIIGHEFTHIKCGHTSLLVLLNPAAGIGVPVISHVLEFIFRWWSRKAEYTADRGGLVVCQCRVYQ